MKKLTILFVFSFIFSSFLFSQTGWTVYSTGTNPIYDFYFIDANTGWVVGDNLILKSTNGGVNWFAQTISYSGGAYLRSVKFINQNTGFVGGGHPNSQFTYAQYLFKTTNGGSNWNILWSGQNSNGRINNIVPINENLIYFSLFGNIEVFSLGGVYKTTNGGLNFSSCCAAAVISLFFLNENTGWLTSISTSDVLQNCKSEVDKTTNGGQSWQKKLGDSGVYFARYNAIQFFNENNGYNIASKNNKTLFIKTSNGGTTWDSISYLHSKNHSMFFINQNTGWISGAYSPDSSLVAYTTNSGITWNKQFRNPNYQVDKIYFVDALNGWGIGGYNNTNIFRTTTAGITFVKNISTKIPTECKLYQNYPNPFNPTTTIKYAIPSTLSSVRPRDAFERGSGRDLVLLKVFNILGKEVATLVNEKQSPGIYEVNFDGSNFPSGIYFYKLEAGDYKEIKKMILLK